MEVDLAIATGRVYGFNKTKAILQHGHETVASWASMPTPAPGTTRLLHIIARTKVLATATTTVEAIAATVAVCIVAVGLSASMVTASTTVRVAFVLTVAIRTDITAAAVSTVTPSIHPSRVEKTGEPARGVVGRVGRKHSGL